MSGKPFNTVAPADYRFWELLNQVVQEEPSESLDQIRLGYYASIGIQKGKPFKPDERMKKILTEAAAVGMQRPVRSLFIIDRRRLITIRTVLGSYPSSVAISSKPSLMC
jgi:hypothetical protein